MGDLKTDIDIVKQNEFIKKSYENKEKCAHCFAKNLCSGGCFHERFLSSSFDISCQLNRHIITLSIWIFGKLSIEYPQVFQKIFQNHADKKVPLPNK